jgi:hypothetical protein
VGRGLGVSAGLGVGEGLGVKVAVAVGVDVGVAVGVCVAVGVGVAVGEPVGVGVAVGVVVGVAVTVGVAVGVIIGVAVGVGVGPLPPQMIISLSVQTAVWPARASGTLITPVAVQLSVLGSYLPPLAVYEGDPNKLPPQIIISLSVQTAVCPSRADGALAVLVIVQLSVVGLYLAPVNKVLVPLHPPQTIISLSDHTAV